MERPQFSLLRLLGAVTCFAVAMGALSYGLRNRGVSGEGELLLVWLVTAMPGIGAWLLSRRSWVAVLVCSFSFVALFAYMACMAHYE